MPRVLCLIVHYIKASERGKLNKIELVINPTHIFKANNRKMPQR